MKRLIVGLAAVLTLSSAVAFAADMAVKAPAANPLFTGYPYAGSGFYWGLSSMAQGENPTINGTVATSLQAFGGSVGGVAGYQWGRGAVAYAFEAGAYYQSIGGASMCTAAAVCTANSSFELVQKVKAITPLSALTSLLPGFGNIAQPALPALPAGITVSNMHAYLFGAAHESGLSLDLSGTGSANKTQFRFGVGAGTIAQLSNSAALDVFVEYLPAGATTTFNSAAGLVSANTGAKYVVGTSLLW